jgi:hypothetical protein
MGRENRVTANSLANGTNPILLYDEGGHEALGLIVRRLGGAAPPCSATNGVLKNLSGEIVYPTPGVFGVNDQGRAVALNLIWTLGPTDCPAQKLPTPRGAAPGYGGPGRGDQEPRARRGRRADDRRRHARGPLAPAVSGRGDLPQITRRCVSPARSDR